jgi:hypothetical protein
VRTNCSIEFKVYDENVEKAPAFLHDASRKFVVMSRCWPSGTWRCEGRYSTLKGALDRTRILNRRN